MEIGNPPWSKTEILASIDEFLTVYDNRPIKDNQGGIQAPHMFAVWFMAKKLSPEFIIESGIWKGQSTWLLEQACPKAELFSIDLNLKRREYISDKAVYSDRDFSEQDWTEVSDRTLVFFDDHQNAYKRLQQCQWFGFKHLIFDDNYPSYKGDCYSLKKVLANAGFQPDGYEKASVFNNVSTKVFNKLARLSGIRPFFLTPQYESISIPPNDFDSRMLHRNLEIYYEFPPVCRSEKTRWGADWKDSYPTPEPLLERPLKPSQNVFLDEAMSYTWVCYAKLK